MSFPTVFPYAQLTEVIASLRGVVVDKKQLVTDVYDLLGYSLGVWFNQTTVPPVMLASTAAVEGATDADRLEKFSQEHRTATKAHSTTGATAGNDALPAWLLPLLLQILQKLLG